MNSCPSPPPARPATTAPPSPHALLAACAQALCEQVGHAASRRLATLAAMVDLELATAAGSQPAFRPRGHRGAWDDASAQNALLAAIATNHHWELAPDPAALPVARELCGWLPMQDWARQEAFRVLHHVAFSGGDLGQARHRLTEVFRCLPAGEPAPNGPQLTAIATIVAARHQRLLAAEPPK